MTVWHRLTGGWPIVTRLVLAVAAAMSVVLVAAGAFVFWRVSYALDRQLDQDLRAYQQVVEATVKIGASPPPPIPGQSYQVYAVDGSVLRGGAASRLSSPAAIAAAAAGSPQLQDDGHLFPPSDDALRVVTSLVVSPDGPVVVASAISRAQHDEALRELLLQLAIAALATLIAASYVGYRTARAALDPVERYRRAAAAADPAALPLLPIAAHRDDELTRLGLTFNALLSRIAEAQQRERRFLADAAHELRSPLSVMRTELEWVQLRPRTDEETAASLGSLTHQAARLIDLSNSLLDLEEVRASADPPDRPVDLAALVEEVVSEFEAQTAGRPLVGDTQPGLVVPGDHRWLELALANLVTNALRHGSGAITVSARPVGRPGGTGAVLAVEDEGPGFPPEFVARAFERFARAEHSRTTPGTGLGLALVQAVAEAHGAVTRIDGAKVSLEFPHTR